MIIFEKIHENLEVMKIIINFKLIKRKTEIILKKKMVDGKQKSVALLL